MPVPQDAPAAKMSAGEPAKPAFDPQQFRADTLNEIKMQNEQLQSAIISQVKGMVEGVVAAKPAVQVTASTDIGDFADEVKALGMDEAQTKALTSLMDKHLSKRAPAVTQDVTDEVIKKIDKNTAWTQKKTQAEFEKVKRYPDIKDPNSPLFKRTEIEYQRILREDPAMANSHLLTATAIQAAADALDIRPLSLRDIQVNEARMENGGSGSLPKSDTVTKKQTDFAASFGVTAEKFQEKLKLVRAK